MKKIINGKLYNTDTAKVVIMDCNGGSWRDFSHWEERLYRKRTGEYFLHGEGGPMTKYAESCGQNEWSGGSKIIPLTYEAAREWAEKHGTADEFKDEFGAVSEGDETATTLCISMTSSEADALRRLAQERGLSVSKLVTILVSESRK